MRIGYDAKRAFKNFTGLGNYSRSVISIMASYYPANEYYLYTSPYKPHASNVFAALPNIGIYQPKGFWRIFHSSWRSLKLAGLIKKDKIDIYHGLSHELPAGIQNSGAKSIVTMHDLIVLRYPHLYKAIDRNIYLQKYRMACKYADLIIAISRQTKDDLINLMGVDERKIRLVYQSCDPQFYNLCTKTEKLSVKQKYKLPNNYILNVGTIEQRKNLVTIVRALALLPSNVSLLAVGKPTEYMKTVKAEMECLGLQHRIQFLHGAQFTDLPAIYQQAQTFVYPSVFEGFGIPILEALNSRIPVITADMSSLPEVGGDAALYIEPEDSDTLAQHIKTILHDKQVRETMIEKGITQAAKFREEQIAKSLWAVYKELVI
ncbi:MAG: glycosyltransferase family 4 protein [Prevotellaceae bacterium]|jgi:glycosyltransferase involved in cell wall biosynthesis|nr:glycosyltransferase family 4 protein [Prevotellaceae bacterium]